MSDDDGGRMVRLEQYDDLVQKVRRDVERVNTLFALGVDHMSRKDRIAMDILQHIVAGVYRFGGTTAGIDPTLAAATAYDLSEAFLRERAARKG